MKARVENLLVLRVVRFTTYHREKVAAITVLSPSESVGLSLQQHLDLTPDLFAYSPQQQLVTEADSEPLMMAQPVPHQATDRKRVKVYELRNNDWFDRGTGFCIATFTTVCMIRYLVISLSVVLLLIREKFHQIYRQKMAEKIRV